MNLSKIRLFSFLTLSCSLIVCGQAQSFTAPNPTSGAIAPTKSPTLAVASAKGRITTTQLQDASTGKTVAQQTTNAAAESLHSAFEEIRNQPCDERKPVVEKGSVFRACTASAGGRGQFRFISASEHGAEAPDVGGIVYWYYLNGRVAAITFAHDGTSFMFDQRGELQAELISAQKIMVNGRERFQNRSIRTNFTKSERDRLEKLAQEGGKAILSKFKPTK